MNEPFPGPETHSDAPSDRHYGPLPVAVGGYQPIEAAARPDLKRALPAAALTILAFFLGSSLGGINRSGDAGVNLFGWHLAIPAGWVVVLVIVLAVAFVFFGLVAGRSIAKELARVSTRRAGVAAGSAIRLIILIVSYLTIALGVLAMLDVDLSNLLVGGAVTGVVIGIAAQQTLGNFFAGLVLLFAKPYVPGQRIKVHSGALGGPFVGVIVGAGIMYTFIQTSVGIVSLPNAGLLGSAIGPADDEEPAVEDEPAEPTEPTGPTQPVPPVVPVS